MNPPARILLRGDAFPPRHVFRNACQRRVSRLSSPRNTVHTDAGFLQREAEIDAPKAILRQLRRSPTPPDSPEPELEVNEEQSGHQRRPSLSSLASSPSIKSFGSSLIQRRQDTRPNSAWKEPQPFEVLRAVERRDLLYLMEIRDRSFHVCVMYISTTAGMFLNFPSSSCG